MPVEASNSAVKELLQSGNLHLSLQSGAKTIERPEPILFHYLLKQPAVSHTPYDQLFSDTSEQIKRLKASFQSIPKHREQDTLDR
jgi:hypothetical protein